MDGLVSWNIFYDWQAPRWVRIGNGQQRPCRFIFWVMVLPLITRHFIVLKLLEVRDMRVRAQRLARFLDCFLRVVLFPCFLIQGGKHYVNQQRSHSYAASLGSLKTSHNHGWHVKVRVKYVRGGKYSSERKTRVSGGIKEHQGSLNQFLKTNSWARKALYLLKYMCKPHPPRRKWIRIPSTPITPRMSVLYRFISVKVSVFTLEEFSFRVFDITCNGVKFVDMYILKYNYR